MGNPNVTTTSAPAAYSAENGIMASVPGDRIAAGCCGLPAPESTPNRTETVVVDGGWVGMVRITYESTQLRHRRSSYWAWLPKRVDRV